MIIQYGDIRLRDAVSIRRDLPHGWPPRQVGDMVEEYGHLWVVTEASGRMLAGNEPWDTWPGDTVDQYVLVPVGEAAPEPRMDLHDW